MRLTALSDGMQKQQLKDMLLKVDSFHIKLERELADAVLGVAIKVNWQMAQELRGDGNMCEVLMELMEPEINKIKESVREETTQQGIKNAITVLKTSGHTNDAIKNFLVMAYSITQSEAEKYL